MMVSKIIYLHIENNIMCPSENYYLCDGMMPLIICLLYFSMI